MFFSRRVSALSTDLLLQPVINLNANAFKTNTINQLISAGDRNLFDVNNLSMLLTVYTKNPNGTNRKLPITVGEKKNFRHSTSLFYQKKTVIVFTLIRAWTRYYHGR